MIKQARVRLGSAVTLHQESDVARDAAAAGWVQPALLPAHHEAKAAGGEVGKDDEEREIEELLGGELEPNL